MPERETTARGPARAARLRRVRGSFGQARTPKYSDAYRRGLVSVPPRFSVEPTALAARRHGTTRE